MRNVLGAVFLFICFSTAVFADEKPVLFVPELPKEGVIEKLKEIRLDRQYIEDIGQADVCLIILEEIPMEPGEPVPLDEAGEQQILLGDGMTYVTAEELLHMVTEFCTIIDPEVGILADLSFFIFDVIGCKDAKVCRPRKSGW